MNEPPIRQFLTQFEADLDEGARAFRAGEPYDDNRPVGWALGYGNAISITPSEGLDQ